MDKIFVFMFAATCIEAVICYIKDLLGIKLDSKLALAMSAILGIIIAIAFDIDILAHFGLETTIPLFGNVMSGVILSRGSNYLHDSLKKL